VNACGEKKEKLKIVLNRGPRRVYTIARLTLGCLTWITAEERTQKGGRRAGWYFGDRKTGQGPSKGKPKKRKIGGVPVVIVETSTMGEGNTHDCHVESEKKKGGEGGKAVKEKLREIRKYQKKREHEKPGAKSPFYVTGVRQGGNQGSSSSAHNLGFPENAAVCGRSQERGRGGGISPSGGVWPPATRTSPSSETARGKVAKKRP